MNKEQEIKEHRLEESLRVSQMYERGEITRFEKMRRLKEISKIVE